MGLTPGCLSKGISLQAKNASRCFTVLSRHSRLVIPGIAFLKSSPDEPKFPDIKIRCQPSASKPEGPPEPRVFSIASHESILSYITGCAF